MMLVQCIQLGSNSVLLTMELVTVVKVIVFPVDSLYLQLNQVVKNVYCSYMYVTVV